MPDGGALDLRLVEPAAAGLDPVSTALGVHTPVETQTRWFAGRVGGSPRPGWADGSQGAWWSEETVWRTGEAWWWPQTGAVCDLQGRVFRPTLGPPRPTTPGIGRLKGVSRGGRFRPPARTGRLGGATVFMTSGGRFNYGHFVLDSLTALLLSEEAGLLDALPPAAPPLRTWHRDLIRLALPGRTVREVEAPVVHLAEAAFASPMDHFLHHPNRVLQRLQGRILANAPPPEGPKRLYLSRRGWGMRVMVDEPALEAALAKRGFAIVQPERLPVERQIALMRGAEVVIAPSGAALANTLFCPPKTRVIEIQPDTFHSQWVRALRQITGGEWAGWFTPAPIDPRQAPRLARMRREFRFAYRTDVEAFLTFVKAQTGA